MMYRKTILQESFTFQNVQFVVEVYLGSVWIHPETGEIQKQPADKSSKWVSCKSWVCEVVPDSLSTTSCESLPPDYSRRNVREYEPLEKPKSKIIGYTTQSCSPNRTTQEIVDDAIEQITENYSS